MSPSTGSGVSRRTFMGGVAALPLAALLDVEPLFAGTSAPRIVVVGAGAFGGWTALQLRGLGAQVTLIDAWGPGNVRSSSGGETRVIRAIYGPDRIYVEMVKRSFEQWSRIDTVADEPLYVETGVLWMHRGDDDYVRSSAPLLEEAGFPLQKLELAQAVKRYPQIDFGGVRSVWLEQRGGALSARRACGVVRAVFEKAGGTYRTADVKPGAIANGMMSGVMTGDGSRLEADAYVFACGPWLGKVFPEVIGDAVRPTRQEVYYFGTPRGSERYAPPNFPVWIDFGERIIYGLPDTHRRGFKFADDTRGELFDPTSGDRTPTKQKIEGARKFLAERFPEIARAPLISAEVCQYENSPDGHLIMDRHPAAKNVWLLGGGSGHGFKLSPAVGKLAADAVVGGSALPKLFSVDRLKAITKPSTQFESKHGS
jgi:glycine/D-amino acid oxidase-like deaminating enzyme